MAEKLSVLIELEGAEQVQRDLAGIGTSGQKAFADIAKAAENVGGFNQLDPAIINAAIQKFGVNGKEAIEKISAAVATAGRFERIVQGITQVEAGFAGLGAAAAAMAARVEKAVTKTGVIITKQLGPIGAILRALGPVGIGAGVAGGAGLAAVEFEKMADQSRLLEANLQALFRNQQQGTAFFNAIQNAAQTAGAELESTGQTMVGIAKTLQKALTAKGISFAPGVGGFKQANEDAAKFFDTLQKGMKLSGTRAGEANKAIAALFTEINVKGQLSGDALREFAARFPPLANELVKFLGTPGQSMEQLADQVDRGIRKIDIIRFMNALKRADPEIQKLFGRFDLTLAQRMDTIGGAWERLLDSFGKSPSGAAIKGVLDDIAKGLDEIAKKQAEVGKFTVEKPPETLTGDFLNEVLKTIETTKKEWEALVQLFNQTKINLRLKLPDKIVVPFEADAEPKWVEIYLKLIEKVKAAFKSMFTPEAEAEGPPQQPAWVEAYLGFIAKVKAAFLAMFTKPPEQGGQLGGQGVPFLGGQIPADVVARGAARIEDRRGEGLDTTAINTALTELATAAGGATQSLQGLQGLDFSSIGTAVAEAFSGATAAAQQLATDFQNLGLSEVAAAMQEVVSAANSAAQALVNIQAQGNGGGGFAHGGLLGGRGTGTSDSNLAWVSRGEHIMPARAVRQPGVLAFLEALRRSGGSLRDVLDDMGRFALGGLVPRTIPAFAAGGLGPARAGGGRPIALTINAGGGERQTFHLWADEQVADSVLRYATKRQVASAGRKSGAFG